MIWNNDSHLRTFYYLYSQPFPYLHGTMKDRLAFGGFHLITLDECVRTSVKGVVKWVLMQPLHTGGSRWCQRTLAGREAKQEGRDITLRGLRKPDSQRREKWHYEWFFNEKSPEHKCKLAKGNWNDTLFVIKTQHTWRRASWYPAGLHDWCRSTNMHPWTIKTPSNADLS